MSDRAYVVLMMTFVIVLLGSCIWLEHHIENMRTEAVMRGYAEWYSEKEGQQPNKWRWKESVE